MIVLDSSAVLAAMLNENGADNVHAVIDDSVISSINAAEIITKLVERGLPGAEVRARYENLRLEVIAFDESLAIATGFLRSATRHKGLSLGDRACLALAIRENGTAVTADRKWADLDLGCTIKVIR